MEASTFHSAMDNRRVGFNRNLYPEKVLTAKMRLDKSWLVMKWIGSDVSDEVLATEGNQKCPQLVIAFYERLIKWTGHPLPEPQLGWNLRGFRRGLDTEGILGATTNNKGEMIFLMKWKYSTITNFVLASDANDECPEVVIAFYESKCRWGATDSNGERRLRGCYLFHTSESPTPYMF